MAVWRSFHPRSTMCGGRIGTETLTFSAEQSLVAGTKVEWFVNGYAADHASCSLAVDMALYDERVSALQSIAEGGQSSLAFLSFDVLTASCLMDEEKIAEPPCVGSNASVAALAPVVDDFSRRVERIWNFVGGCNAAGLERLAQWALKNRARVHPFRPGFGLICAAFVYGEPELAHALVAEYKEIWEEHVRSERRDLALEIYANIRVCLDRLLEAVKPRTLH